MWYQSSEIGNESSNPCNNSDDSDSSVGDGAVGKSNTEKSGKEKVIFIPICYLFQYLIIAVNNIIIRLMFSQKALVRKEQYDYFSQDGLPNLNSRTGSLKKTDLKITKHSHGVWLAIRTWIIRKMPFQSTERQPNISLPLRA